MFEITTLLNVTADQSWAGIGNFLKENNKFKKINFFKSKVLDLTDQW